MSPGTISGSQPCFRPCTKHNLSAIKSRPQSCSGLLFKTHLVKPIISIKNPSGTYRVGARAAINNLCGTSQGIESFYDLLGVSESGTPSEIKKAYKQLALKYHPDVSPPDHTEEYTRMFISVQQAYETLSDPRTRAMYDRDMAKGLHLASSRRGFRYDQKFDGYWEEWRNHWQSQLMELKRRSENKDSIRGRVPWGARMCKQRSQTWF